MSFTVIEHAKLYPYVALLSVNNHRLKKCDLKIAKCSQKKLGSPGWKFMQIYLHIAFCFVMY